MISSVGDGSGVVEMATTAAAYKVIPPEKFLYTLERMHVYIEDNAKFRGDYYGGSAALATGIKITKENAGGVLVNYTPYLYTKIGHWGLGSGRDMQPTDFQTGNDIALVRWTFNKAGQPVTLNGNDGEFLKFNVADSLAALVSHLAIVQGNSKWIGG